MVCEFEEPTVTLPRLALAGVKVSFACRPVPVTATTAREPCVVETVMLPERVSCAWGLKVIVMVCVCPGVSVTGRVIPLVVVSVPLTVTCEIVTFELPELVSVTFLESELPALMLPKLRIVGLAVSVVVAARPVPLKLIVEGEPAALLVTVTAPVRLPAVVGANTA